MPDGSTPPTTDEFYEAFVAWMASPVPGTDTPWSAVIAGGSAAGASALMTKLPTAIGPAVADAVQVATEGLVEADQANADAAEAARVLAAGAVPKAGATGIGPLGLAADPTAPEHAARKAYVDAVAVPKAGATGIGPLGLASPASQPTEAVRKGEVDAGILSAVAASATFGGGTIAEVINGVTVTTTFPAAGQIREVYGAPINQTWLTTISGGTINKVRTA